MGKALAEEAIQSGYDVQFITGPVSSENLPALDANNIHSIQSAEEMLAMAQQLVSDAQVVIFAAAVADYTPIEKLTEKMGKSDADLTLQLRPTPDIAKTLGAQKREDQIFIGFALQTSDGETHAQRKLTAKNLDGIILNTPASLGAEQGTFTLLSPSTAPIHWGSISKQTCATRILDAIEQRSEDLG